MYSSSDEEERENGDVSGGFNNFSMMFSQNSFSVSTTNQSSSISSSRRSKKTIFTRMRRDCQQGSFFKELKISSNTTPRVKKRPKSCVPGMRKSRFAQLSRVLEIYDQGNHPMKYKDDRQMMDFDFGSSKKRISNQKSKRILPSSDGPFFKDEQDHEEKDKVEQVERVIGVRKSNNRRKKLVKSTRFVRGRLPASRLPKLSKKSKRRRKRRTVIKTRKKPRKYFKANEKLKIRKKKKVGNNVDCVNVKPKKPSTRNIIITQRKSSKRIPQNSSEKRGLHREDVIDMSVFPNHTFSFQRDDFVTDHLRRKSPEIDRHALRVSKEFQFNTNLNLSGLMHLLFHSPCIRDPLDKYRVIFRFIAERMKYRLNNSHPHDAMPLLRRGYGQCCDYARCFKSLCDAVKLRCRIIGGFCKGINYTIGDDLGRKPKKANHDWNMIFANGKWVLCDLTWSAGRGGIHEYNDRYWCVPPQLFITDHFPEKSEDQLLQQPPKSFTWFGKSCLQVENEGIERVEAVSHMKPLIHMNSTSEVLTMAIRFKEGVEVMEPGLEYIITDQRRRRITITKLRNTTWIDYDPENKFHVITVMFEKVGDYHLTIYAKNSEKNDKYDCCFKYKVKVKKDNSYNDEEGVNNSPFLGFPLRYGVNKWYQIVKPYQGTLEAGYSYDVVIHADPGQWYVLRIKAKGSSNSSNRNEAKIYYDEDRKAFVGEITPRVGDGTLTVYAYKQEYGSGEGLFQFKVL